MSNEERTIIATKDGARVSRKGNRIIFSAPHYTVEDTVDGRKGSLDK